MSKHAWCLRRIFLFFNNLGKRSTSIYQSITIIFIIKITLRPLSLLSLLPDHHQQHLYQYYHCYYHHHHPNPSPHHHSININPKLVIDILILILIIITTITINVIIIITIIISIVIITINIILKKIELKGNQTRINLGITYNSCRSLTCFSTISCNLVFHFFSALKSGISPRSEIKNHWQKWKSRKNKQFHVLHTG